VPIVALGLTGGNWPSGEELFETEASEVHDHVAAFSIRVYDPQAATYEELFKLIEVAAMGFLGRR